MPRSKLASSLTTLGFTISSALIYFHAIIYLPPVLLTLIKVTSAIMALYSSSSTPCPASKHQVNEEADSKAYVQSYIKYILSIHLLELHAIEKLLPSLSVFCHGHCLSLLKFVQYATLVTMSTSIFSACIGCKCRSLDFCHRDHHYLHLPINY